MKTIYKYPLAVTDEQIIMMPNNASLLCLERQYNQVCMWCVVDTEESIEPVKILVFGTGHRMPDSIKHKDKYSYLGTVQAGDMVWHYFRDFT